MKYTQEDKELHEALLKVADFNIDYLSYKGQEKWNRLTKKYSIMIDKKERKS